MTYAEEVAYWRGIQDAYDAERPTMTAKVVSINKKLKSAQAMLKECFETPNVTRCIIIVDGDEMDCPLYCQHGMSLAEMAYFGALIMKEALA